MFFFLINHVSKGPYGINILDKQISKCPSFYSCDSFPVEIFFFLQVPCGSLPKVFTQNFEFLLPNTLDIYEIIFQMLLLQLPIISKIV